MKKLIHLILITAMVLGVSELTMAQSSETGGQEMDIIVTEIKVIEIVGSAFTLTMKAPSTAGNYPDGETNYSTLAQYTSVTAEGPLHRITAQLDVALPPRTYLFLRSFAPAGCGTSQSSANLSNTEAKDIITSIDDCMTGSGESDGAALWYTLTPIVFGGHALILEAGSTAIVVTLTIL